MALVRYHFRGRGATNFLIFVPLTAPEIVLGASLLTLFLNLGTALGFWTIVLAHIMFCISFVVVTVRARLVGFDRHVEEAAAGPRGERVRHLLPDHASADRAGDRGRCSPSPSRSTTS